MSLIVKVDKYHKQSYNENCRQCNYKFSKKDVKSDSCPKCGAPIPPPINIMKEGF